MSNPTSSTGGLAEAVAAFRRSDLNLARSLAEKLVAREPGRAHAWELIAATYDQAGQLDAAAKALARGIAANPDTASLYNYAGAIWTRLNDMAQAEGNLVRAVTIQPGFALAWSNLSRVLTSMGKHADAIAAARRGAEAEPNHPQYAIDLAVALAAGGDLNSAEQQTAEADRLSKIFFATPRPQAAQQQIAGLRLRLSKAVAEAFLARHDDLKALGHFEDAVRLGAGIETQSIFISLLRSVRFVAPRPSLKPLLQRAFIERWAPAIDIAPTSVKILLLEPDLKFTAQRVSASEPLTEADLRDGPLARTLIDPLLLTVLERALVADAEMETFLRNLRHRLLQIVTESKFSASHSLPTSFCVALALQCFLNEYSIAASDAERALEDRLRQSCIDMLAREAQPQPAAIALLCAYGPFEKVLPSKSREKLARSDALRPVLTQQWDAPMEERRIRTTIPKLTVIQDETSQAVQRQYEDNPFPMWVDPPGRPNRMPPPVWLAHRFPMASPLPAPSQGRYRILVAGCGTGHETAALDLVFADTDILALDLSLTSLAFAKRKSSELGHRHVTYAQADLLEYKERPHSYDIVFAGGVLHHLAKPLSGWAALKDQLKPGGAMFVALYSMSGRRAVTEARQFAAEKGYGSSAGEIRRFRHDVTAMQVRQAPGWRNDLIRRVDFYNISMLRDLLFHVQETTYTIPQIGEAIEKLGFLFRGFDVDAQTQLRFRVRFGEAPDAAVSLQNWAEFEEENPMTFSAMYHFLVQKPKD